MNALILDGHPDEWHLASALLDQYARSLPPVATILRIAARLRPETIPSVTGPWKPSGLCSSLVPAVCPA